MRYYQIAYTNYYFLIKKMKKDAWFTNQLWSFVPLCAKNQKGSYLGINTNSEFREGQDAVDSLMSGKNHDESI